MGKVVQFPLDRLQRQLEMEGTDRAVQAIADGCDPHPEDARLMEKNAARLRPLSGELNQAISEAVQRWQTSRRP